MVNLHTGCWSIFYIKMINMNSKKILVQSSERNMLVEALKNQGNEKLDILNFVVGGLATTATCNQPPNYPAFVESTYVRKT